MKKEGDVLMHPPAFAQTLRELARDGIQTFYNGSMGDKMVEDIRRKGGIITKEDLMQYR